MEQEERQRRRRRRRRHRRCGTSSFFWIRVTFILLCLYQFFYTSTTTTTTHHEEENNNNNNNDNEFSNSLSLLSEPFGRKEDAGASSSNIKEDDDGKKINNSKNNNDDRHHHHNHHNHQKQQQRRQRQQQDQDLMKLLLLPTNNNNNETIIGRYDYFSDSWLLNRYDFLNIDVTKISTVEDACFHVIDTHTNTMSINNNININLNNNNNNSNNSTATTLSKAMMFKDWTNFLVEHMSKWWKSLQILSSESTTILFDHVITKIFHTYIQTCYENMIMRSSSSSSSSSLLSNNNNNADYHYDDDDYYYYYTNNNLLLQDGGIAMIAFQSYESSFKAERGHILTAYSLAATIVSLIQGLRFRRIVVVGYQPTDKDRILESFQIIDKIFHNNNNNNNKSSSHIESNSQNIILLQLRVGSTLIKTDVVYVQIQNLEWVKTKDVAINIPRGAIMGMQLALTGKLDKRQTIHWLGGDDDDNTTTTTTNSSSSSQNNQNWKYFYLTEPDTILNIKPEIVPFIKQGLDHYGFSFFPHRLQPLPHESDLPSSLSSGVNVGEDVMIDSGRYIPNNIAPFSNVTTLINNPGKIKRNSKNSSSSSSVATASYCCDGGKVWPGRNEKFNGSTRQKPCNGKWWWGCGFKPTTKKNKKNKNNLESNNNTNPQQQQQQQQQKRRHQKSKEEVLELHKRLVPYPMMRLEGGTGVVFGSTEMGRRCFPSINPCSLKKN